jgi:hypothetical protein
MTQSENIFDEIAQLLPVESREHFYRKMARLRDLTPNDDMLQIAEAMGFLALLIRQTPVEIAAERAKLDRLCQDTVTAIQIAHDRTVGYQRELDERLLDLPASIAGALNPASVASFLSETLRQHLVQTSLPAIAADIARHTQALSNTAHEFGAISESLSAPERGAPAQIGRALTIMQANLDNAACHIRTLSHALAKDLHRALAIIAAGALFIGFFLGVSYVRWTAH